MPHRFSTRSFLIPVLLVFLALTFAGCTVLPGGTGPDVGTESTPQLPQPKTLTDPTEIELLSAIQTAAQGREDVLAFIIFRVTIDHVQFSADKNLALVWVALVDKQTGLVQSGEPGLVIAHRSQDPAAASPWQITFQADTNFAAELQAVPLSMLNADIREQYMPAPQQEAKAGTAYGGYLLPWTGGSAVYLTGSIGHVYTYKSCPSTCLYAFDFANGTMFPIRAAKAGTVKYVVWGYPNGNTTNANYIVLEDTTTNPTTYQVYLHLAQNSIPVELRTVGTHVVQGQFLGNADDTGVSTGNHLHFHVHTNPTSYWGTSVDIVFSDVTVNGGRPRMCSEASAYPSLGSQCMPSNRYVSGNLDKFPPTGGITSPAPNAVITSKLLNVSGWATDDVAIDRVRLRISTDNVNWTPIGDYAYTSPFTVQIDLCAANIPDGAFALRLGILDKAGNGVIPESSEVKLIKKYPCSVPTPQPCIIGPNQVGLYELANFAGACRVLNIGDYQNLASISLTSGANASIQFGTDVSVIAYPQEGFGGTPVLLQTSEGNLGNNPALPSGLVSMRIVSRMNPPASPQLTLSAPLTTEIPITLSWDAQSGVETSSQLTGPGGYSNALDWQTDTTWNIGMLEAGTYTWTVQARNLAGIAAVTEEFTIVAKPEPPVSAMLALPSTSDSTALELQWEVTAGADRIDHFELQYRVDGGEWALYDPAPLAEARSVVFNAEAGKTYEFRIRAIAVDSIDEAFPDAPEAVTQVASVAICMPDNYELANGSDASFAAASPFTLGETQEHDWCPAGDTDWVTFQAKTGDQLQITTEPLAVGSAAGIILYDTDGSTILGSVQPVDENSGASLDWTVPSDGTYAVQLSPVNPAVTGTDARYKVSVVSKGKVELPPLLCGTAGIPAALAGLYVVSKKLKKKRDDALGI